MYKRQFITRIQQSLFYLKVHLGEGKTLNISKWKSEVATLKKDKQNLYNQILEIREEVEQAEKS